MRCTDDTKAAEMLIKLGCIGCGLLLVCIIIHMPFAISQPLSCFQCKPYDENGCSMNDTQVCLNANVSHCLEAQIEVRPFMFNSSIPSNVTNRLHYIQQCDDGYIVQSKHSQSTISFNDFRLNLTCREGEHQSNISTSSSYEWKYKEVPMEDHGWIIIKYLCCNVSMCNNVTFGQKEIHGISKTLKQRSIMTKYSQTVTFPIRDLFEESGASGSGDIATEWDVAFKQPTTIIPPTNEQTRVKSHVMRNELMFPNVDDITKSRGNYLVFATKPNLRALHASFVNVSTSNDEKNKLHGNMATFASTYPPDHLHYKVSDVTTSSGDGSVGNSPPSTDSDNSQLNSLINEISYNESKNLNELVSKEQHATETWNSVIKAATPLIENNITFHEVVTTKLGNFSTAFVKTSSNLPKLLDSTYESTLSSTQPTEVMSFNTLSATSNFPKSAKSTIETTTIYKWTQSMYSSDLSPTSTTSENQTFTLQTMPYLRLGNIHYQQQNVSLVKGSGTTKPKLFQNKTNEFTQQQIHKQTIQTQLYTRTEVDSTNLISVLLLMDLSINFTSLKIINNLELRLLEAYIVTFQNASSNVNLSVGQRRMRRNVLPINIKTYNVKIIRAERKTEHSVNVMFNVLQNGQTINNDVAAQNFKKLSSRKLSRILRFPVLSSITSINNNNNKSTNQNNGTIVGLSIVAFIFFLVIIVIIVYIIYSRSEKRVQKLNVKRLSTDSTASSIDSMQAFFGSQTILTNPEIDILKSVNVATKKVQTNDIFVENVGQMVEKKMLRVTRSLQTDALHLQENTKPETKCMKTQTEIWIESEDKINSFKSTCLNSMTSPQQTIEERAESLRVTDDVTIANKSTLSFLPKLTANGMPLVMQPVIEEKPTRYDEAGKSMTLMVEDAKLSATRMMREAMLNERNRNKMRIRDGMKQQSTLLTIDSHKTKDFSAPKSLANHTKNSTISQQVLEVKVKPLELSPNPPVDSHADPAMNFERKQTKSRKMNRKKKKHIIGEDASNEKFIDNMKLSRVKIDQLLGIKEPEIFSPAYKKCQAAKRWRWQQKTWPAEDASNQTETNKNYSAWTFDSYC